MSKITFRADDELITRIEAMDASKSEVMREALRAYLGSDLAPAAQTTEESLDTLITDRIDQRINEHTNSETDVNISITVEDDRTTATGSPAQTDSVRHEPERKQRKQFCVQCGETVDDDHVYCPNCGEKSNEPAVCECGVELRADWAFCPGCGRRTPAADVLDR